MLAMMSTVAKAFEIILECRLVRWLDRVGGSLTFEVDSARSGRSTLDLFFVLTETNALHKERGMPLFLAFIDVRKAYERVWRPGIWYKLGILGMSPRFLRLLQLM